MRGLLRRHPTKVDLALSSLLIVVAETEIWLGDGAGSHRLQYAISAPLMAITVAARRRYPTAAGTAAGLLAVAVADLWGPPNLLSYAIAWVCAMYGLAVWSRRRRFLIAVVAFGVALGASATLGPVQPGEIEFILGWLVLLVLVRYVVGDREQRLRMAERERDMAAREAVVEERAQIARELHDVIAHEVSMMVLQAGAERKVLGDANASTRDVLLTIEKVGRSALTEMRRMVGLLRRDIGSPPSPQPVIADVARLVDRVREAGLPVDLLVEGDRRELPAGIELSAFRIVQEALTNTLKHAGEARAQVRIRYANDALELEIVDDGRVPDNGGSSGGHGLAGMRERVAIYGGCLEAGSREGGGFVVRAQLPLR